MDKEKKKRGATICAAIFIGLFVLYFAVICFPMLGLWMGDLLAMVFLLVLAGIIGAVIWGIVAALRQRLKEIDGGEEEEAKKY